MDYKDKIPKCLIWKTTSKEFKKQINSNEQNNTCYVQRAVRSRKRKEIEIEIEMTDNIVKSQLDENLTLLREVLNEFQETDSYIC